MISYDSINDFQEDFLTISTLDHKTNILFLLYSMFCYRGFFKVIFQAPLIWPQLSPDPIGKQRMCVWRGGGGLLESDGSMTHQACENEFCSQLNAFSCWLQFTVYRLQENTIIPAVICSIFKTARYYLVPRIQIPHTSYRLPQAILHFRLSMAALQFFY